MPKKFIYNNYLKNISNRYSNLIGEISANYNFDLGMEFELVLCEILRKILPNKFGICRGFWVAENGKKEGDDIIIYDQIRFPQIRLLDKNNFAHSQLKLHMPILRLKIH